MANVLGIVAVACAVIAGGCGSSEQKPAVNKPGDTATKKAGAGDTKSAGATMTEADVLALMKADTDAMCACKDAACADALSKKSKAALEGVDRAVIDAAEEKFDDDRYMACRRKARAGGSAAGGDHALMNKLNSFRDEMCACKALPCAQDVNKRLMQWVTRDLKGKKPPKEMRDQVIASQKAYTKCYMAHANSDGK